MARRRRTSATALTSYKPPVYQRGYGLGSVLSALGKTVLSQVKKQAPKLGNMALREAKKRAPGLVHTGKKKLLQYAMKRGPTVVKDIFAANHQSGKKKKKTKKQMNNKKSKLRYY